MRRTNTFCRIEYLGHSQSRHRGELSDIVEIKTKYSREKRRGIREVNWRSHRRTLGSVGNVGSRFFLVGAVSIADRVGIGIDLMLLVENIG